MATYIAPISRLKLLSKCPLVKGDENTLFFENSDEQYRYFNALTIITGDLTNIQYQRYKSNVVKVQVDFARCLTVNYMMFQNSQAGAGGNKWYYAFVDKVEYVNPKTTRIYYTLDPLQTYLFNYKNGFKNCLVERQHSEIDNIGSNIEPENIGDVDIICKRYKY